MKVAIENSPLRENNNLIIYIFYFTKATKEIISSESKNLARAGGNCFTVLHPAEGVQKASLHYKQILWDGGLFCHT